MTTLHPRIEAELAVAPGTNVGARTVVAIQPSDADPIWDEMRVVVNGVMTSRPFDPGDPIVTGAPIAYVTEAGIPYVTEDDEPYVTEVAL